jgi:hypothetical protein
MFTLSEGAQSQSGAVFAEDDTDSPTASFVITCPFRSCAIWVYGIDTLSK